MAMTVTGAIRLGEANGVAFRSARRVSGRYWLWLLALVAALLGVIGLGAGLGWWLQARLQLPNYVTSICLLGAVAINLAVVYPAYRRFALRKAVKRLRDRGLPDPVPCTVTVGADALTYALGGVVHTLGWGAVSDLFPAGGYWVVVAQGGRYFVPRRFFPDPAAERAGVAEMLGFMSDAARARAKEAAAFVGGP